MLEEPASVLVIYGRPQKGVGILSKRVRWLATTKVLSALPPFLVEGGLSQVCIDHLLYLGHYGIATPGRLREVVGKDESSMAPPKSL